MIRTERIEYSEGRRRPEKAASYSVKYERQLHKRLSSWREKRLLSSILETSGRHHRLLDVPCGAGRLSAILAAHADSVCEVDYSGEMVKLCRGFASGYRPLPAVASVFQLPFADGTFDMVVSIRLSHHIPDREGRLAHLRELLRTSRRYVLVTFFADESLKNRLRNLHRLLGLKKRPKYTLSRREVEEVARQHRFRIVRLESLSRLFSGHLLALLRRD